MTLKPKKVVFREFVTNYEADCFLTALENKGFGRVGPVNVGGSDRDG